MLSCRRLFVFIFELLWCCQNAGAVEGAITATPTPLSIPPSQFWDGNDGPWSSFILRVGSPPQSVRVLISTASNQPWVILPEGCSLCLPSDCPQKRGGLFSPNTSSTWFQNTIAEKGIFSLPVGANLETPGTGVFGYDHVALSHSGSGIPALENQVVSGIATKALYTGFFGLNPAATNFSASTSPAPSYMSSLKSQGLIPSLSYGYTAGNQYRQGKVPGSLTLGGYDQSLFESNDLSISFSPDYKFELSVNVKSISMTAKGTNQELSSSSFAAMIDSTTPYLFLPLEVCQRFEQAFGIVYDPTSGLYLVNDTLHERLLQQSASVILTLTNSTEEVLVDITLPYQAFDLVAEYPLVSNSSRYFPLKRATNRSQVTLGRTFFQEAYLIADYERKIFSLHQRKWSDKTREQIQTILPQNNNKVLPQIGNNNNKTIVATTATIGGLILIALLILLAILLRRRRSKIKIFLASQSMRHRSHSSSHSPPRPRISRPILIPSTPEIEPPSTPTPTRQTQELDSQPVSPISPDLADNHHHHYNNTTPDFSSLAHRIENQNQHSHSTPEPYPHSHPPPRPRSRPNPAPLSASSRPQTRYHQLYDDIIQEVHEQIYSPNGNIRTSELEDPFTEEIHELPATPGFVRVEEEMAQIYRSITEVERAMIRERQEARSRELIREGSRYDPRRESTPATNWI